MTLTKRISELLIALNNDLPERESAIQIGFLASISGEPFYIYGRSGSGKNLVADRLVASFKNAKILRVGRQQAFPNNLNSFDVIVFPNFNPLEEGVKENVQMALAEREKAPLILTSDQRPEVMLSRADITDHITLSICLPESLSAGALCNLLKTISKDQKVHIPMGLTIAPEELKVWNEEIRKVALSEDTLGIIGKLAELCNKEGIYVSIRKWIALTNMVKAIAFFNGRTETRFTDTLFLGTPIWVKAISNTTITENFTKLVKAQILKDIPAVLEAPYDANGFFKKVSILKRSNCNRYDTKMFNNEPCLCYKVTIAGETNPLYVPLRYIETDEDFHPFNEFRKEETRIRCNFKGSTDCSVSIDSSVRGVGLRGAFSKSLQGKFEDYARLPSYVLQENDPEIAKQKKIKLEEYKKEAQVQLEIQTKYLIILRDLFLSNKQSREDLFCDKTLFDKIQGEIRKIFDDTTAIANKLKETLELFKDMQ